MQKWNTPYNWLHLLHEGEGLICCLGDFLHWWLGQHHPLTYVVMQDNFLNINQLISGQWQVSPPPTKKHILNNSTKCLQNLLHDLNKWLWDPVISTKRWPIHQIDPRQQMQPIYMNNGKDPLIRVKKVTHAIDCCYAANVVNLQQCWLGSTH